jgi:isochorismate synthase
MGGATPEMLLRSDQQIIKTVSLAGTRNFHQRIILWIGTPKELEEQNIVTNYIKDCLKKFGITEYQVDPLQTVRAGLAAHLSTTISFKNPNSKKKSVHSSGNSILRLPYAVYPKRMPST